MHVLNPHFPTVSFVQLSIEFTQCPDLLSGKDTTKLWHVNIESPVQIFIRKSIFSIVCQLSVFQPFVIEVINFCQAQWIQVSFKMSMGHIGSDKLHDPE